MEEIPTMPIEAPSPTVMYVILAVYLAAIIFYTVAVWKIYVKAGKPGWGCLIPIYNIILFMGIVNRPGWWVILLFIPFVNIIVAIIATLDLAKAFGKSVGFGVGLLLLGCIFYPILAFGSAQHTPIER